MINLVEHRSQPTDGGGYGSSRSSRDSRRKRAAVARCGCAETAGTLADADWPWLRVLRVVLGCSISVL